MILRIFENNDELADFASEGMVNLVLRNPDGLICATSGSTPIHTYEKFVQKISEKKVDISQLRLVGLDEWLGIPPSNSGSCDYFLRKRLIEPLNLEPHQYHLFDGLAKDEQQECVKMDDRIRAWGGIKLMIVGVGMNGHVGLNEPSCNPDQRSYVADLHKVTIDTAQKYFTGKTLIEKGFTLGLEHFFDAEQVLMMANGEGKADIIRQITEEPISMSLPASQIRKHKNGLLLLDQEAASDITVI